jgi:hypothetical protein
MTTRWFPPSWRRRYGAELDALIADMAAGGTGPDETGPDETGPYAGKGRSGLGMRPRRVHLDLAKAGLAARWDQLPGVALVLWGWALFVVGGCAFAKWSEHFHRAPLSVGSYDTVVAGALCGALAIVVAGVALFPVVLSRHLREGLRHQLRTPGALAVALSAACAGALEGLATWAHALSTNARNGADLWYGVAFLCTGALGVVALFVWTSLAVRVLGAALPDAGQVAAKVVRGAGTVLVLVMVAIAAGSGLWASRTAPLTAPFPVVVAIFMASGLALGIIGARRDQLLGRPAHSGPRRP